MPAYAKVGGETTVNSTYAGTQHEADVAVLADGRYVVIWLTGDASAAAQSVVLRLFAADGTPLGGEITLVTSPFEIEGLTITGLTGGGFVAAGTANGMVHAQRFASNGATVGGIFTVSTDGESPEIVGLANGGFAVSWHGSSGADSSGLSTHVRTYNASGTATSGDVLVNTTTLGDQHSSSITALAGGGFVVTWCDNGNTAATTDDEIMAQIFNAAGARVGGEFAVNTNLTLQSAQSKVTALANGNFAVAWLEYDAALGTKETHVQIFTATGARVGNQIETPYRHTLTNTGWPEITELANGDIAIVWTANGAPTSDGSERGIFVQVYRADGTPASATMQVNAQASGAQQDPAIAPLDNGGFVITWTDLNGAGADDDQVKAQVFGPPDASNPIVIGSNGGGDAAAVSVAENLGAVTTVAATGGVGPLTYAISGGADASSFTINATTGALSFAAAPNFEAPTDANANNVYDVVVSASDATRIDTQALAVTVTNVNEAPVITSNGAGASASISLAENATAVTTVAASDPEGGVTYSISGGADAARFTIDASTGALSFTAAPNFEAPTDAGGNNVYDVIVRASDGSLTDTQAIAVTVTNANDAPVITSNGGGDTAAISVAENTTAVTTVTSTDPENTAPSYSISGGVDAARFTINASTGALSFLAAPNFEAPTDAGGNNVYDVTVRASDGSLADTQAIAVTVTNGNEAPVISSNGGGVSASISVAENATAVTTVVASDADGPSVTYAISGGADAARFTINASTGALSFLAAPDFEAPADSGANNVYNLTVSASDGSLSDTQALTVTVTNTNETPVISSNGGGATAAISVAENTTAVTTVVASDPEGGVTYSISGGADAARFSINASTGALRFVSARNFESPGDAGGNNIYDVTVSASDGSLTDTQAIAVTVTNVNEAAPVISSNGGGASASISVAENATAVTTVVASDADGTAPTYAISGGADAARFAINASTGALSFLAAADFEAPTDAGANNVYNVTVSASDGSLSDTQALTVTVTNVNEAPVITSNGGGATAAISVSENSTAVTTVAASDPENTARTYSIAGGADAARFSINASTGALSFVAAPNFEAPTDTGGDNVYDVTVRASDGSLSDTQAIAVTVTNVNEAAPVISSNGGGASASISVAENATTVTTVVASDADGTAPTYAISGGADAARFAINASTGALSFLAAPDFEAPADSGANNVYNVTVSASDGTLSDTQALTITVTNANEAPVISSNGGGASASISVTENATTVTTVVASDPDGGVTYSIAGGADAARFTINASTGALSFAAAPNFEAPTDAGGNNVYDVTVSASDGSLTDSQALTVTVTNVNEVPVISSNGGGVTAAISMAENSTAVTTVAASDPEGGVTYAIAGGADAARFAINASTGALSFLAVPDFEAPTDAGNNNVYDVVVSASDGSLSDTQAIAVTVTNANEAPVIASNGGGATAAISVAENTTAVTTVAASDPEGGVTYSIVGGADAAHFAINTSTGALSFAESPNFEAPTDSGANNAYEVTVQASDGSLADTQTLTITVTNVNETPVITSNGGGATATISVAENSTAVTTVNASDPEGGVTYSISGGADAARFSINVSTGALSFVSSRNFEAPTDANADNIYEVTVQASDGTLTDTQAVSVTVANVNEAVTITSGTSFTVAENGLAATTVTATDLDGDTVSYAIAGGDDASRFTIDAVTGALSFVASPNFEAPGDANADNVYNVIVSASDGTLVDTQAISVTVANVNEAVTITSGTSFTVAENGLAVTMVAATDLDGTTPNYAISGGADAARFTIDAVTGALSFVASPNFEAPTDSGANNVYDVVVSASDGSLADTQAIAVTVTNANEAVTITSGTSFTVAENGLAVTTVTATDLDGTAPSYSISGGADAAHFIIDAATGALSFVASPDFEVPGDSDANNVYDVIVKATDGSLSDIRALTITVTDTNEAPAITSDGGDETAALSMLENTAAVTTVVASDPQNAALSYSIAGGDDAALFTIDAATGALSFLAAPDFEAPADAGANNVYNVVVAASNGVLTDTQALAITVGNANESLSFVSAGSFGATENGTAVGIVAAIDLDGDAVTYAIAGGDDAALFVIDAQTGELRFTVAPDFEAPADADGNNAYEVVVSATDGTLSDTQAILVTVANVNEAVTITSGTSFTVAENGLAVTSVTAVDLDGDTVSYAIAGGDDAALFVVEAATGVLSFLAAPDFEAPADADGDNAYEVVVSATDGSFVATSAITVAVGNANESLSFVSTGSFGAIENGTAVGIVAATDLDGDTVSYAIAGGDDAALFVVDAETGQLSFAAAPDFEAPADADGDNAYEVVVSASDGSFVATSAITVAVANANEGLSITSGSSASALENQVGVTTVTAVDLDGDAVSYSISGGDDAVLFTINASTGALSFLAAPDFEAPADAGADNDYDVIVSASDGTLSDTRALTITVGNVNEAVAITSGTSFTVAENGFAVTTVTAVDLDGDTVSYAIAGGDDAALFVVDAQTGELRFAATPDFEAPSDADGDNVYEVTVQASDGTLTDTQALTVTVTNANESLSFVSAGSFGATENGTAVGTVAAVDLDGDTVTYTIDGGDDATLFVVDAQTGALSFLAAPDFEAPADADGDNAYEVVVSATDGSFVATSAITVAVANANEGLSITSGSSASALENQVGVTTVTAVDLDGDTVSYAIAGGDDAALFVVDAQTGELRFAIAPDFEAPADADGDNAYEVVVSATDGSFVATSAITVAVTNANEGLSMTSGTSFAVEENATSVTMVAASDIDGDALVYSIAGGADAAAFTIDASTGALDFLTAPDFEAAADAGGDNVYDVIVRASDGSFDATAALSIGVGNRNEGVAITSGSAFAVTENETAVCIVTAVDADNTLPTYAIVGGADAALFVIDAFTGALSFESAPDFEAAEDADQDNVFDVVVQASDGFLTDERALAITVGDANDAPTVQGALADVEVATGGQFAFGISDVSFSDADGDQLTISVSLADGSSLPTWIAFDGTSFSGTAPTRMTGEFEIRVRASDGSAEASAPFTLRVTSIFNYITGTAAMDVLTGTSGRDDIMGLDSQDLIAPGAGADYVDGGNGSDAVIYSSALSAVSLSLTSGGTGGDAAGDVYVSIERATGSAYDDVLEGSSATNFLSGGGGNDVLTGLAGNDTLNGEAGSDTLYGGDGNDGINQADWNDGAADQIYGEAGDDTLKGGAFDVLEGGAGADQLELTGNYGIARGSGTGVVADSNNSITITGNLVGIEVDGGLASDTLYQQNGYDVGYASLRNVEVIRTTSFTSGDNSATMTIDFASLDLSGSLFYGYLDIVAGLNVDTVINGPQRGGTTNSGNRLRIYGADGNDTLTGSSPTVDQLYGNAGNDQLSGLDGADVLNGGAGADRLTGGLGADTFAFTALADSTASATDLILDFTRAQSDKISLSAIDANSQLAGDQAFAFIGAGTFSGTAGQLRYFQSGGDTFVEGDVNGDAVADFLIGIDQTIILQSTDFAL